MNDRLYSPYAHDEPVDHDALYDVLRRRRQDHNRLAALKTAGSSVSGELFSPEDEKEEEEHERGWEAAMVKALSLYSII
jgi:hypothetical protein